MKEQPVIHSTFVIERDYPAPAPRVFAAFADPARKRRWGLEGGGHEVLQYEMDFRVGGKETAHVRFKQGTPVQGLACANETTYLDIIPNRRIVSAATMTIGGRCISAALITVELLPSSAGTSLVFTHQAAFFEGADGPEMREHGWNQLFSRLVTELTD